MVSNSTQCRHLALIGDHKQLPPVITSPEAQSLGLGRSLFERLTEEGGADSLGFFFLLLALRQARSRAIYYAGHSVPDAPSDLSLSVQRVLQFLVAGWNGR